MNRRDFFKTFGLACAGAALGKSPKTTDSDDDRTKAKYYSYVRCPECDSAMTRIEDGNEIFITCCGRTYKEPTVQLERVA